MKERPIIFSTEMVRAILEDRKTQTRRVIKPQIKSEQSYYIWEKGSNYPSDIYKWDNKNKYGLEKFIQYCCPYGKVGDRLWVRETWKQHSVDLESYPILHYKADYPNEHHYIHKEKNEKWRWKSPIHMPRWASRITLEITDIRVERLQEISREEAIKEGIFEKDRWYHDYLARNYGGWEEIATRDPKDSFMTLWNFLAKKGFKWEDDPWVWVISFRRIKGE